MGQTLTIKCPKCGKQYKWSSGPGFIVVETLHCDRCGKEKVRKRSDAFEPGYLECSCGGTFKDDAPVRCPKCKKVIEDVEESTEMKLLWD